MKVRMERRLRDWLRSAEYERACIRFPTLAPGDAIDRRSGDAAESSPETCRKFSMTEESVPT